MPLCNHVKPSSSSPHTCVRPAVQAPPRKRIRDRSGHGISVLKKRPWVDTAAVGAAPVLQQAAAAAHAGEHSHQLAEMLEVRRRPGSMQCACGGGGMRALAVRVVPRAPAMPSLSPTPPHPPAPRPPCQMLRHCLPYAPCPACLP